MCATDSKETLQLDPDTGAIVEAKETKDSLVEIRFFVSRVSCNTCDFSARTEKRTLRENQTVRMRGTEGGKVA